MSKPKSECGGGMSREQYFGKPKPEEVGVDDIFQVIVTTTLEGNWYPQSDNKCMELAEAIMRRLNDHP